MNYDEAISFDMLYEAMLKCEKGVKWKNSTLEFTCDAIGNLNQLSDDLKNGTYKPQKGRSFVITRPKKRNILSVSFRDRIYQRSLNDNIIYPAMTRTFIYDNCACQKDKGTDFARGRILSFLRSFYNKYKTDGYALKIDIKGYYPNMSHEYAENLLRKRLDRDGYEAAVSILRSQYSGSKGYDAGSQLIQIIGISALDDLDHYIKEHLHIRYYVRYMDDLVLIHPDKDYLKSCLEEIKRILASKGMIISRKKTRIYTLSGGFDFLGFSFQLTDTGKALMICKPESVKSFKRHIKNLVIAESKGKITKVKTDECVKAILSYLSKGNNYWLKQRIERYYKEVRRNHILC